MKVVIWAVAGLLILLLIGGVILLPKHPVALLQVVDAAGQPVRDAVIRPEGMRTKSGPYQGGWYGWRVDSNSVPATPVRTDRKGEANVPYPEFVFERIETGVITMSVEHPDFVPARPERIVSNSLPRGAPWRERLLALLQRLRGKATSTTDPIVLRKGAVLTLVGTPVGASQTNRFFAQLSGYYSSDTNFWQRPSPNVLTTKRLAPGTNAVRAIQIDEHGSVWFSEVVTIDAQTNAPTELKLDFKRGVTLRGRLDDQVPRPVRNGRMVANVWPPGHKPQDSPPTWHGWSPIKEDGTFEVASLPAGDLEVVALCDGFVSTNGPGQFQTRYPQRHSLDWSDREIIIGMERTVRLEVQLMDRDGNPIKDARVTTWPNVRYGEWGSVILLSDCYNTEDFFIKRQDNVTPWWKTRSTDFEGTSGGDGVAVLPNLPSTVKSLALEHARYTIPIKTTPEGTKHRQAEFKLVPGETNRISLQLEPRDQTVITHY